MFTRAKEWDSGGVTGGNLVRTECEWRGSLARKSYSADSDRGGEEDQRGCLLGDSIS